MIFGLFVKVGRIVRVFWSVLVLRRCVVLRIWREFVKSV
jgi:hypothetical protein